VDRSASPQDSEPVASIDGEPITQAELDAWIKEDLFREQTEDRAAAELYDLRARSLERLIDERVLAAEARRRGVTTDEVLRAERDARGEISDEQVTAFYEKNKQRMGGATRDQVADRIRSFLDDQRTGEITADLRKQAKITLLLEPPRVTVAAEGPSLGPADAPVTIVEYASMTCPHCAHFHETTYPELKKRYIDTGKVRFIFREFPLDPLAAGASMLARCAGKDKYFPLIETLFQQQRQWAVEKPIPPLMAIVKQAGFTEQSFNACLSDQKMLDALNAERGRAADKFGVNSTPTLFINGKVQKGGATIEELVKIIEPMLKG
jgi:protein-disulfide isomerase